MIKEIQLRVNLIEERKENILLYKASKQLSINESEISAVKILRKSIDARKKETIFNYKVAVYINEEVPEKSDYIFEYKDVSKAKEYFGFGAGTPFDEGLKATIEWYKGKVTAREI